MTSMFILFVLTLLFYSIERAIFLFWNISSYKDETLASIGVAFLNGLRFDIVVISYALVLFLLVLSLIKGCGKLFGAKAVGAGPKKWFTYEKVIFLLINLPFLILNVVDAEMINFMGRRFTLASFYLLEEANGKVGGLIAPNIVLFCTGCLTWAVFIFLVFKYRYQFKWRQWFYLPLLFVGLRGGWQMKPINFAHAQVFAKPTMNNLILNSGFTTINSVDRDVLARDQFFKDNEEMLSYLRPNPPETSLIVPFRVAKPQNVVVLILESFSLEYMGRPFGDKGYTPFLDEMSAKGLFFQHNIANARRSIEGVAAVLAGVPALMNEPFISSQYLTNYFWGVGSILEKQNYNTSFFHGGKNGTMFFDQFIKSVGIKNYYGSNEYPNQADNDGTWGIYDEPFLQFMLKKLNVTSEPFFSAVFTLSSHNPFRIPEMYKNKFPKGSIDIHESLGYSDYALRKFFEEAQKQPWYENTLFILTADHTYKPSRPEFDNEIGRYQTPLIFYHPRIDLRKVYPQGTDQIVTQQIDVLPSILDFLGVEMKDQNLLGKSVFIPTNRAAITYSDGRYYLVTTDYVMTFDRGRNNFQMFAASDRFFKKPLTEPSDKLIELENQIKARIQYFSQGLWDNKLYYPSGR